VEKITGWITGLKPGAKRAPGGAGDINRGIRNSGGTFSVIVTGGSNNNYFSMGGMIPSQSIQIDKWRQGTHTTQDGIYECGFHKPS
jgi:hypothetical protein